MTGTEKEKEQRAGCIHPCGCGNYKEIGQEKWWRKLLDQLLNPKTRGERTVARGSNNRIVWCDLQRTVVWNQPWGARSTCGHTKEDAGKDFRCPQGSQVSFPVGILHRVSKIFWGFSDMLQECYSLLMGRTVETKWFTLCRCPSHQRTALDFPVLHLSPWGRIEVRNQG